MQRFSIYLVDCIISTAQTLAYKSKKFQITFDGARDGNYFRTQGTASGIALQILDINHRQITPGQPLNQTSKALDIMRFDYYLQLVVRNGPIKAGDYFSVIRFEINYF